MTQPRRLPNLPTILTPRELEAFNIRHSGPEHQPIGWRTTGRLMQPPVSHQQAKRLVKSAEHKIRQHMQEAA
ncbi:MAG: hypothetical protein ACKVWR_21965 [Acidimicrobiales bacterium]